MATGKRTISTQEEFRLRGVLQTATLAALIDSRRWEPGELAFQGGTSLHLAHGSARFSEDLDFMVCGGLSMKNLSREVQKRLRLPSDIASDLSVSVTPIKDLRNPHSFYVTLSGRQVIGSAKVKIELWQTPAAALHALTLKVSTIASPNGQTFVPTLTLPEIFADKVYALGARERIKPRDVYDLWWLCKQGVASPTPDMLHTRLCIYPAPSGLVTDTAQGWTQSALARLAELQAPGAAERVAQDLKRWLPSSWPIDMATAASMLASAVEQLKRGIDMMHSAAAAPTPND
jgi:predicted nucleotidyltransferase component of viral defense system